MKYEKKRKERIQVILSFIFAIMLILFKTDFERSHAVTDGRAVFPCLGLLLGVVLWYFGKEDKR